MYMNTGLYPTRNGLAHVLFTWNSSSFTESFAIHKVRLFFTTARNIVPNEQWDFNDTNPFSDSMTAEAIWDITYQSHDGDLYEGWWSGGDGYTVVAAITYTRSDGKRWMDWYYPHMQTTNCLLTNMAPSITYNNGVITIGSLVTGRRILEFHTTDEDYGGDSGITDEATLNEMLYTSLICMEPDGIYNSPYIGYYGLSSYPTLERWRPGSHSVGVRFVGTKNQGRISDAIDNAISEINSVLSAYGMSFYRNGDTSGEITILVDGEDNLFPYRPEDYYYGGQWETTTSGGYIVGATIKLANDFTDYASYNTYETVAFEEILQCMGAGFDQLEYPFNTIHTDFNYYNKSSTMYERDADILRLVYWSGLNAGDNYVEVSRKLNIPKGCYQPSENTADVSANIKTSLFLEHGHTYRVRAFIVDSNGRMSATSDWLTIMTPDASDIEPWTWLDSNGVATAVQTVSAYNAVTNRGDLTNFSYLVWNDLVDKVNEAAIASGDSWIATYGTLANTKMSANEKTLTASRFNAVRLNIGAHVSTGIAEQARGDPVLGSYFTTLTVKLNEWIGGM